MNSVCDRAR